MKTSSIIIAGGSFLISCAMFLLQSCDSTSSLSINGKQMLSYPFHGNEIRIAAGRLGPDCFLFISSDKTVTIQPDSFQYAFSTSVDCKKIDFFVKERKHRGVVEYLCSVVWRNCSYLPMDSAILRIFPNDYIIYQGNRVITDTIFIHMNRTSSHKKL